VHVAEAEGAAHLRLQQAELSWSLELQRTEARLGDATEARAKLEAQVAALTQARARGLGSMEGRLLTIGLQKTRGPGKAARATGNKPSKVLPMEMRLINVATGVAS
jgi:hypothetical protein